MDKRGKNPNSQKNLEKGRTKGHGRPVNAQNITYWLREFGAMTPVELAQRCKVFARELRKGGDEFPIFAVIAVRQLMELMKDSDARVLDIVLERLEGKVKQPQENSGEVTLRVIYDQRTNNQAS